MSDLPEIAATQMDVSDAACVEHPASINSCTVKMFLGDPCGRPLYKAPADVDATPVCLLHSKHADKSVESFMQEVERVLHAGAQSVADFSHVVFPVASFVRRGFRGMCMFHQSDFLSDADFRTSVFVKQAYFEGSVFRGRALFDGCKFLDPATFTGSHFQKQADFRAEFVKDACFGSAHFEEEAFFRGARFNDVASFAYSVFKHDALFEDVVFMGQAGFVGARFDRDAHFTLVRFNGDVDFSEVRLSKRADFSMSRFRCAVDFTEAVFRDDASLHPGPVFDLARFDTPNAVVFRGVNLRHALFFDCDTSRVMFSDITWRTRPGTEKRMLFEEVVDLEEETSLCDDEGARYYPAIAEVYHQLKKNFDERGDYWTAEDFHYGEMEMLRLSSSSRNPAVRWLHRNLGIVAWYRRASEYGRSITRPLIWLVSILLLFTLLYPLSGLRPSTPRSQAATVSPQTGPQAVPVNLLTYWHSGGTLSLLMHSAMTAVSVASLQRDLAYYEPGYGAGRALALLELLLTSTLAALFLLALRRQFKR